MEQIKDLQKIVGLTIQRVHQQDSDEDVYLFFGDSFIRMTPCYRWEDHSIEFDNEPDMYEASQASIIDSEEFDRQRAEVQERESQRREAWQAREYERLKAKFDPKT